MTKLRIFTQETLPVNALVDILFSNYFDVIGHSDAQGETGSYLYRTALWVCLRDTIASLIGDCKIVQETGSNFVSGLLPYYRSN